MTARELIGQWFNRRQAGVEAHIRYVTTEQIAFLRKLIDQDAEAAALRKGMDGSFIWMPSGCDKWVVTFGPGGKRNTIARLSNIVASESGRLFPGSDSALQDAGDADLDQGCSLDA